MKNLKALILALAVLLLLALPAGAITYGEPDNGRHPFVGTLVAGAPHGVEVQRVAVAVVGLEVALEGDVVVVRVLVIDLLRPRVGRRERPLGRPVGPPPRRPDTATAFSPALR